MPLLLGGGGQGYRARGVSVPPPPSVRRAPALAEEEVAVGTASRCRAVLPRSSAKIKIKKAEGGGVWGGEGLFAPNRCLCGFLRRWAGGDLRFPRGLPAVGAAGHRQLCQPLCRECVGGVRLRTPRLGPAVLLPTNRHALLKKTAVVKNNRRRCWGSASHGRGCPGLGSHPGAVGCVSAWLMLTPPPASRCSCVGRVSPCSPPPRPRSQGCPGLSVPLAGCCCSYFSAGIGKDPRKSHEDCLYKRKDGCLRIEGAFSFTSRNPKVNKGFSLTNEGITLCWGMGRRLSFSLGEAEL